MGGEKFSSGELFKGMGGGVGLADGFAPCDSDDPFLKRTRESRFPRQPARAEPAPRLRASQLAARGSGG
jgi:hypothetical protein